jgi:endonuclease/exonuclease/phosphatase family metal-dependent hydrolase
MRLLNLLTLLLICFCSHSAFAKAIATKPVEVVAMTFNLRVPVDPAPLDWNSRRHLVAQHIKSQQPDFFGVQEAVPNVVSDVALDFPHYAFVGRGRDKGGAGEGTQIFYKANRWRLDPDDNGTLQLSPTPDIAGSNGWEMQFPRIFTWARLIEKKSGKAVYVFNTHFPLVPKERLLSSILLARAIADRKYPQDPVILSGDFNACEEEDSIQYLIGVAAAPVRLIDSYRELHPEDKTGTFHDFGRKQDSCKIDYILMSSDLTATAANIIKDDPALGFASDHYAVTAKIRFPVSKH